MEPRVREEISRRRTAVMDDPNSVEAWGALGRTFHAHGLDSAADESYSQAERLDSTDFRWPYLRAAALTNTRPNDALEAAYRASELQPEYPPAHLLAAELLERAGNPEGALNLYRHALSLAPDSAVAELGIGRLLMRRDEIHAAREHLERAAALEPRAGPVQAALARFYAQQGDREAARRAAAAARGLSDTVPAHDPLLTEVWNEAVSNRGYEARALRAEAAGNPQEAAGLYERLLVLNPEDPDLLYNFGNFHLRGRRFEEAATLFERALALRPDHVAARVNRGNALLVLGRREEAAAELQRALEQDPADADAHRTLAALLAYRGENDRAIAHYRAVIEASPQDGEVHRDLAIVLAAEGEFAAAWEHVELATRFGAEPSPDFLLRLRATSPRPQ